MPDYYYRTAGEAFAAVCNAFNAFDDLTYLELGFAITWHTGALPNGGYFKVEGDGSGGPAFANGNYYARDMPTAALVGFVDLVRQPGMQTEVWITTTGVGGDLSAQTLKAKLTYAKAQLVNAHTSVTDADEHEWNISLAGSADPVIFTTQRLFFTSYDQIQDTTVVVDKLFIPAGAGLSVPVCPTIQQDVKPVVNNVIQAQPELDIDQGINAGGSIYSVTSKQLTSE
jgi:hypothetical protein